MSLFMEAGSGMGRRIGVGVGGGGGGGEMAGTSCKQLHAIHVAHVNWDELHFTSFNAHHLQIIKL